MKKIALLLLVFFAALGIKAQQDPQYNLYQFNQMVINPAYAGARDGLAAILSTRKQWAGFDGAPQTSCFSIHSPIMRKNIGIGLTVVNDIMGPRNVISAYGNFAYILKLSNRAKLSFGLNGGYNRYQFRFNDVSFKDAGEVPQALLQNQIRGTLDINGGFYLKTPSFFAGLSGTHLNTPNAYTYKADNNEGKFVYRLKTHLFFTMGKSFIINKDLIFAPTTLVKIVNSTYAADLNLNFFLYKKIWLGAFYRNGYGPGALMQYYVTNKFRVAYSYDTGLNDARRLGGSHEIMFGYDFSGSGPKTKMINPRFL